MTRSKLLGVFVMLTTAIGCEARDGEVVDAESNDLGIARIEIHHGYQDADPLLTIVGLDTEDHELARATLRTGTVLYTPDSDLFAPGPAAGTELTTTVGEVQFVSITPDRVPHEVRLPAPELTMFMRLRAVAAAVAGEAGISFAAPKPASDNEVALTATNCDGSRFPTTVGDPTQCCQDGNSTWHKIGTGSSNTGKLGYRTYDSACTNSGGYGGYCGDPGDPGGVCTYGPCGSKNEAVSGSNTTSAMVFHPSSQPSQCGRDSNGSTSGGGMQAPEAYSGSQSAYTGVAASCGYTTCCFNSDTGYSEPHSGGCPVDLGGACSSDSECMTGQCNSATGTCVPSNCNANYADWDCEIACCEGVCRYDATWGRGFCE